MSARLWSDVRYYTRESTPTINQVQALLLGDKKYASCMDDDWSRHGFDFLLEENRGAQEAVFNGLEENQPFDST
jgi:hypothetical protein